MDTQAYFTNIRSHISAELKNAASTIYVAVAWFTDPQLFSLLCAKAKAGLDVQLIVMDDDTTKMYGLNYTELEHNGGKVLMIDGDTTSVTMHNKFCVIDGLTTITGS
jgi:phosphatidylserine/phosphatidylglycerophosphate/cardiolipin synthase-like enzyme